MFIQVYFSNQIQLNRKKSDKNPEKKNEQNTENTQETVYEPCNENSELYRYFEQQQNKKISIYMKEFGEGINK